MVNGFHFASIAVFVIIKVRLLPQGVILVHDLHHLSQYKLLTEIAIQLIPGGVVMGLIHFALLFPKPVTYWQAIGAKLKCC
jgi:hypothetical protein